MKKLLLIIGTLAFVSCGRDEIVTPEPSNPYAEPANCGCGTIVEMGTDRPLEDSLPFTPTDYWVLVENHCSQNTRRFPISQDQVVELADDSVACFYIRW
jgi:hypothetical protein